MRDGAGGDPGVLVRTRPTSSSQLTFRPGPGHPRPRVGQRDRHHERQDPRPADPGPSSTAGSVRRSGAPFPAAGPAFLTPSDSVGREPPQMGAARMTDCPRSFSAQRRRCQSLARHESTLSCVGSESPIGIGETIGAIFKSLDPRRPPALRFSPIFARARWSRRGRA